MHETFSSPNKAAFLLTMLCRVVPASLVKKFDYVTSNKKLLDKRAEIEYNLLIEKLNRRDYEEIGDNSKTEDWHTSR